MSCTFPSHCIHVFVAAMKLLSPTSGTEVQVTTVCKHPQFSGKFVVQSTEDGYQWTHPLPTIEELAKLYNEDYNTKYG